MFIIVYNCVSVCINMVRVNVTLSEEDLEYLKEMKRSGEAASLSHAIRKIVREHRTRTSGKKRPTLREPESEER